MSYFYNDFIGVNSENGAHRIAVEWDDKIRSLHSSQRHVIKIKHMGWRTNISGKTLSRKI